MIVTALWIALLATGAGLEVYRIVRRARYASLRTLVASLGTGRVGRLLPVVVWAWVGWHLFARYTLPP
jgi:Family of unknown function (DUF6186)